MVIKMYLGKTNRECALCYTKASFVADDGNDGVYSCSNHLGQVLNKTKNKLMDFTDK